MKDLEKKIKETRKFINDMYSGTDWFIGLEPVRKESGGVYIQIYAKYKNEEVENIVANKFNGFRLVLICKP